MCALRKGLQRQEVQLIISCFIVPFKTNPVTLTDRGKVHIKLKLTQFAFLKNVLGLVVHDLSCHSQEKTFKYATTCPVGSESHCITKNNNTVNTGILLNKKEAFVLIHSRLQQSFHTLKKKSLM